VGASLSTALELCRSLLAYTAPGTPVSVPHAALAELVDLASGTEAGSDVARDTAASGGAPEPLQALHDVAALGLRYNRARPTIREWFREGLFGPPEERRFRGKEYVATDDAVRDFERKTGLRPVAGQPELFPSERIAVSRESSPAAAAPVRSTSVAAPRKKSRNTEHRSSKAQKILAAQGGSSRRHFG
jgi:hypothetical protein